MRCSTTLSGRFFVRAIAQLNDQYILSTLLRQLSYLQFIRLRIIQGIRATGDAMSNTMTTMRFDDELKAKIKEIADREERTFAGQVHFALREWLAMREAREAADVKKTKPKR